MEYSFLILLVIVFLFLLAFGLIHHEENRKIRKAVVALQIPHWYINQVKHCLLTIYKKHPEMFRLPDEMFYQQLKKQQPVLFHLIYKKLNHAIAMAQLDALSNQYKEVLYNDDKYAHPYKQQGTLLSNTSFSRI